ncbi:MAG TPA: pyridoxal-phosphate dependent enzyme [Paracoccaceae bacterium]|nr:pyridoxal-phosphate dependent enzyme [Paracoccaceae bacterium]
MSTVSLSCIRCGAEYPAEYHTRQCPSCGKDLPSALTVRYKDDRLAGVTKEGIASGPRSIWRYAHSQPVEASRAVSLGEGLTPMIRLDRIGNAIGVQGLYGKCEFMNPTGSFKDRLASAAISAARELFGARTIASSSTGNAGAAVAAYAAKAGLDCVVFTAGVSASPMISQMLACGATVVSVPTKPDRWKLITEGVERFGWFPTSPFFGPPIGSNPFGVEGYKSLAYEICEDLGWQAPDWLILPVCYGDALYGVWKGFLELQALGWISRLPRLVAAEIYGSLVEAYRTGVEAPPEMPQPYATEAASITSPQGTFQSLLALRESGGLPVRIGEAEMAEARKRVAREEGIHLETAAAASVVAAETLRINGTIGSSDTVVCLLTAGGLKEIRSEEELGNRVIGVEADMDQVLETIAAERGKDLSSPGGISDRS